MPVPVDRERAVEEPAVPPVDATTLVYERSRCVVVLDLQRLRDSPAAPALAATLKKLPPFEELASALDPVRDVDWIVWTSPSLLPNPKSAFVMRLRADNPAIDRAVSLLAEPGDARVDLGIRTIAATNVAFDRSPHVLLRRADGIVAVVPGDEALRVARAIARAKVDPKLDGAALRATVVRPSTLLPQVPDSVLALSARVTFGPDGAARAEAQLECPIEQEAMIVAREVQREVSPRAAVAVRGTTVVVSLDAARDEVPGYLEGLTRDQR